MFTYYMFRTFEWLNPLIHLLGGVIAIRAFLRCRKNGYLVVAIYFLLGVFTIIAMPSIRRILAERRGPDLSAEVKEKMHIAMQEAADKVMEEAGNPPLAHRMNINFPLGPILLVTGVYLISKKETNLQQLRPTEPRKLGPGA